ncbi:alpha/beta fold hydrolase [Pilimelia columellifera]|uniref:alpha/beta fold hydrolase n=1 Tax=Pilimelia columellifera TaxID=706574 RepID=UPI0031D5971C
MSQEPGNYAPANGIQLWYRDEGPQTGEPVLLIMGLGSQLIAWPEDFVTDLVGRGYRVIRFDNRDCGLSDKIEPPAVPTFRPAYFLTDMANDAIGLLDHLGIDRAHVVGASMGGMIAQLVAINHPTRVSSLCSIMSTTGNRLVGLPTQEAVRAVLAPTPTEREAAIEHMAGVISVIGSKTLAKTEWPRRIEYAAAAYDRGIFPAGTVRQFDAIAAAVDRTSRLQQLDVPTLVIHGDEDSLINISGGAATAAAIPGARFEQSPTMGHDLPHSLCGGLVEAIEANFSRALAPA